MKAQREPFKRNYGWQSKKKTKQLSAGRRCHRSTTDFSSSTRSTSLKHTFSWLKGKSR
ncbi:hypothetical protein DV515_00018822, partial [Chloebia gouldiae]